MRLYDKNSESDYYFFPPPKSEYFFQQHRESEYFFRNPVYFYPLLCKQFTSIININNALNWLPENPVYYYVNNLPVQ